MFAQGRDVEMADAEPPSEALAERISPSASPGAMGLPEDPAELARALEVRLHLKKNSISQNAAPGASASSYLLRRRYSPC